MRLIKKPSYKSLELYKISVGGVGSDELKKRLNDWSDRVAIAESNYESKSQNHELFEIVKVQQSAANFHTVPYITKKEFVGLYENQVAKKLRPGRKIYGELLITPNKICPFCSVGKVKNLDHFLPKSHFPIYSVAPINLVPSCRDCNLEKNADIATERRQQTLHPYYDDVSSVKWLFARLADESIPPVIEYYVDVGNITPEPLASKVKTHFKAYNLGEIFTDKAADRLCEIHFDCEVRFKRDGAGGLKQFLLEQQASSEKNHKNSWTVAMYGALASSNWYCGGGFII